MNAFLRGLLAVAMLNLPGAARAGGCYVQRVYAKPIYHAPPVIKAVPQNIVNYHYTYNYQQYPAQQGTTLYGYQQVAATYANTDLAAQAFVALASRTSDNAVAIAQLGASANAESNANNTRLLQIAETQNKAVAAERYLAAIAPSPVASVVTKTTTVEAVAGGAAVSNQLAQLYEAKCAQCHRDEATAKAQGGGAVIPTFEQLDASQRVEVLLRVAHPDDSKRMPKGNTLSEDELRLLISSLK